MAKARVAKTSRRQRLKALREKSAKGVEILRRKRENMAVTLKVEVKQEKTDDEVDEAEMEVALDDFVPTPGDMDPLLADITAPEAIGSVKEIRCLICLNEDPDPRPLKGILPKAKGLKHPEQVEDDMRIVYLLKMMFQWTAFELDYLMELANGQSPREWIHLCQSCRLLVFEIQTLEDRMRECRIRIKDKIVKSMENSTLVPFTAMTSRIRTLVTRRQIRSAAAGSSGNTVSNKVRKRQGKDLERSHVGGVYSDSDSDGYEFDDMTQLENLSIGKEDSTVVPSSNSIEELFACPICCSGNTAEMMSTSRKMNIVGLFYHLIYHYDHPMHCSECKICLPRDPPTLDSHWKRYHSGVEETLPEKRFFEKQVYIDLDEEEGLKDARSPTSSNYINCKDCLRDKNLPVKFATMTKFKIHQALEHPVLARESCPLCLFEFPKRCSRKTHFETVHRSNLPAFLKTYSCKFCGENLPEYEKTEKSGRKVRGRFKVVEKVHVLSSHGHLVNTTFTCTQCCLQFATLKEFGEHVENVTSSSSDCHADINWNRDAKAVSLGKLADGEYSVSCGICAEGANNNADKEKTFTSLNKFMSHLTLSHSLYLKWEFDPLNPSVRESREWKSVSDHIKQMKEVRRRKLTNVEIKPRSNGRSSSSSSKPRLVGRPRKEPKQDPVQNAVFQEKVWKTNCMKEKETHGPQKYVCPSCPQLATMNLETFIVHLLFHWRHPNKCSSCKVYLPIASEVIDNHWKENHPDMDSSTVVKFEPVNFSLGHVFRCRKCPQKFTALGDRNAHENSAHGLCSPKTKTCSICKETFSNDKEVRLHKALSHPEITCLSCYYCEEIFIAKPSEGVQYLDSEALHKHILEKHNPPNNVICHLHACDYCGEVTMNSYGSMNAAKAHMTRVHGAMATFTCFICNKGVKSWWAHLTTTHAKNCVCDTCGEEMRPYSLPDHKLLKHGVIMEGYTVRSCKECDFKTVRKVSFGNHVNRNHKERQRSHKCSFCEKAFFDPKHLREHEERHRNKETRPYQCETCGSSYASKNDLYIHRRLSHLNRKFPSTNRKRTKSVPGETTTGQAYYADGDAHVFLSSYLSSNQ